MVLAILQARISSTRLPGKVLRPILGEPMLARQIERLRRSERLTRLVVATSREPTDDAIQACCDHIGVDCHRGDLDDVLGRFLSAIAAFGPADAFVRLTADCPLADPTLIDRVIASHLERSIQRRRALIGNTSPRSSTHGQSDFTSTPSPAIRRSATVGRWIRPRTSPSSPPSTKTFIPPTRRSARTIFWPGKSVTPTGC